MDIGRGQPAHFNELDDDLLGGSQYLFICRFHTPVNTRTLPEGQDLAVAMPDKMRIIRR
jgi:hypothetical protein